MGARLGADKDTEKLIRAARREWGEQSVSITRGNHIRFLAPDGHTMIIGALTGSITGQRKLRAQLKKAGLQAA